jgi:hypothetical protein
MRDLELCWNASGQFHNLVVEEWNTCLHPPGHRHVVDAFHRIVDKHDVGVELQSFIHGSAAARPFEKRIDKLAAVVAVHEAPVQRFVHLAMITIEIHVRVVSCEIVGVH